MKTKGEIRRAALRDAKELIEIYKPYIFETAITFETEVPTLRDFKERIKTHLRYEWLVYLHEGKIVGYAYASKHRDRTAYQWSCEISVYIDKNYHRMGIASKLYRKLLGILKKKNLVNVYAGITLPNSKSEKFHSTFGFRLVGNYKKIGFKLSKWHDVGWYSLRLNEFKGEPPPVKLS